jgi:hypothetical protein
VPSYRRWHEFLSAADKVGLADRYPGLSYDEIAIRAVGDPRYALAFADYDPQIFESADGLHLALLYEEDDFPVVEIVGDAHAFADLVAAVALADTGKKPAERRPYGSRGPSPKPMPRAAFNKAIALLDDAALSERAIAEKTSLTRANVAKIRDWRNGKGFEQKPGPIPNTIILVPTR